MERDITPPERLAQALQVQNISAMRLEAQPPQSFDVFRAARHHNDTMAALHQPG
jgi:hypothetical protein